MYKKRGTDNRIDVFSDRAKFSREVLVALESAWKEVSDTESKALGGKRISFINSLEKGLCHKSLDGIKGDMVLLNVISQNDETISTYFCSLKGKDKLGKKVEKYGEESFTKKGLPRHLELVQSIDKIEAARDGWFWTDDLELMPKLKKKWVEVWLRKGELDEGKNVGDVLRERCKELDITYGGNPLVFPERMVVPIYANLFDIKCLCALCRNIVEVRSFRELTGFFSASNSPSENAQWVLELKERTTVAEDASICVLILDTGVNNGHPLLTPVLNDSDCHTIDVKWGKDDKVGHGTCMAGLIVYGDLSVAISGSHPIYLRHRIESSKIIRWAENEEDDVCLYGRRTMQGVYLPESIAPKVTRIYCMAVTCDGESEGLPTSWSSAMDQLASGAEDEDKMKRLIVVSSGNAREIDTELYPESNKGATVQDPGQAWNVLTVGAYTRLGDVKVDKDCYSNHRALAPCGGLSPYSTTSCSWSKGGSPIKPDVLFEGGNVLVAPDGGHFAHDDLQLLSLGHELGRDSLCPFGETSAASALCANMAVRIQAQYPSAWPETVRALIVHSAEWTEEMRKQFIGSSKGKSDYLELARICGHGVPNMERALFCASNELTLISQSFLQPYERAGKNPPKFKELHFYKLPWPEKTLEELGEETVRLRVTLSYFPEPSPGVENLIPDRYRYPSYGLRFAINRALEKEMDFKARINAFYESDGGGSASDGRWQLGQKAFSGSIHSDTWEGTAVELAQMRHVCVYPVTGWWKTRPHLKRYTDKGRYSLVVSVDTNDVSNDIYTPVMQEVQVLLSSKVVI